MCNGPAWPMSVNWQAAGAGPRKVQNGPVPAGNRLLTNRRFRQVGDPGIGPTMSRSDRFS
jgi:hypothetical protein